MDFFQQAAVGSDPNVKLCRICHQGTAKADREVCKHCGGKEWLVCSTRTVKEQQAEIER